jgi:hypothetical protein
MECVLCRDHAMIPVQYTCFGCDCHQLTVSCRTCAHNFLGLNKKPCDRKISQKCLYCEKTCSPCSLKIEGAYSVNKILMKLDTSKYECTEACGFKGDQLEIWSHLGDCPKRFVRCQDCEDYFTMDKKGEHSTNCSAYRNCPSCPQRIKTDAFREHVVQVHGGHYCRLCRKESMLSPTDHKANECTYRERCRYCILTIAAKDTAFHYKIHRDFFQKQYNLISLLIDTIEEENKSTTSTDFEKELKRQDRWLWKERWNAENELRRMRIFM